MQFYKSVNIHIELGNKHPSLKKTPFLEYNTSFHCRQILPLLMCGFLLQSYSKYKKSLLDLITF